MRNGCRQQMDQERADGWWAAVTPVFGVPRIWKFGLCSHADSLLLLRSFPRFVGISFSFSCLLLLSLLLFCQIISLTFSDYLGQRITSLFCIHKFPHLSWIKKMSSSRYPLSHLNKLNSCVLFVILSFILIVLVYMCIFYLKLLTYIKIDLWSLWTI